LWTIAAGVPTALLLKLKLEQASGWPTGVYFFGADVLRVGFVVASKLPRDRSTVLVRLMAAGPLLAQAIADLAALPANAHERSVAAQILLNLQHVLGKKPTQTPEAQEFVVTILDYWEQAREKAFNEGFKEGRIEGATQAVLRVLRVRGIAVPVAAGKRILAQKDPERLKRWLEKAALATSIVEVLDAAS
jgi:hypothetical protein